MTVQGTEGLPILPGPVGALHRVDKHGFTRSPNPPNIAGYQLVGRFPSSAAGEVYVGRKVDPMIHPRPAIVKFAAKKRDDYPTRRSMLLDEGLALSALNHPNIVRLLEVGETEQGAFVAIELVDGVDLHQLFTRLSSEGRRMPTDLVVYLVVEVLRALEHAHQAVGPDGTPLAMVHRDVNPSNVLVARSGHVRLGDFGIVKMKGRFSDPTAPGMVKGKFRYLAPEYISGETISPAIDVYGVGVMLMELLIGRTWTSESDAIKLMKLIVAEGLSVSAMEHASVPPELVGIVTQATERDPGRRFRRASDMASALEAWLLQRRAYVSPALMASFLEAAWVHEE